MGIFFSPRLERVNKADIIINFSKESLYLLINSIIILFIHIFIKRFRQDKHWRLTDGCFNTWATAVNYCNNNNNKMIAVITCPPVGVG